MQSATDGFTFSPVRVRRRETARAPSAVMVRLFCNESQGEVEGTEFFFKKNRVCRPLAQEKRGRKGSLMMVPETGSSFSLPSLRRGRKWLRCNLGGGVVVVHARWSTRVGITRSLDQTVVATVHNHTHTSPQ